MRVVIWFIVCLVLLMLFAHAVDIARKSVTEAMQKCDHHVVEVDSVR